MMYIQVTLFKLLTKKEGLSGLNVSQSYVSSLVIARKRVTFLNRYPRIKYLA